MLVLLLGIFSPMPAIALPAVSSSLILLLRVTPIISLLADALLFYASYIQTIGSGVSGLF